MEAKTLGCQNCKKNFTIEPEDFNYYKKINVPAPTWCPECRLVRRLASDNIWNLSWQKCAKCGIKVLSMHPEESTTVIYCQPCWWADDWDGTEFGADYDPSRPFLQQLRELSDRTPFPSLQSEYLTLKNSDYSNHIGWSRDCYLVFWADYCDNVFYSSILNGLRHSSDCIRGWDSELCYDSIGFIKHYKVVSSDECDTCVNVWFSRNCYGCTNCIGCVNLRNASNCIFNVKYSKEEYEKKALELRLDSWEKLQELEKEAHAFWLTKPYREYHGNSLNLNVTGEYVFESKNTKESYIANYMENSKWTQFTTVPSSKDCYDYSGWGNNATRIYESFCVGENADSVFFSSNSFPDVLNLQYCNYSIAGKNNFGCFSLKRKKYCILNKEYSKEEFEKLKSKIIEDMKENPYIDKMGRKFGYGEFLPPEFSKFPYNKSNAMKFFPKTKEEATSEGYTWSDTENPSNKATMKSSDLPDTINETTEAILNEVLECLKCGRGYKIVKGELDLLRKMGLPVPHECPKCRENRRFTRMNRPGMHHRNCDKCKKEIYTPYASERPEIVYCVQCYQQEFI